MFIIGWWVNSLFSETELNPLFLPLTSIPPPCLVLPNLSPWTVGIQVQVFVCIWCLSPFPVTLTPCMRVLTDTAASVGGPAQCSPVSELGVGEWSESMWWCVWTQAPVGNRRLTWAASCLSCFVKAANLPFVAADSSDKQERKWRIFRDGNKIRSWGGGRAFPWGMGSSHEDLCYFHITASPSEPRSVLIFRPTFVLIFMVRFLGFTSSQAFVFQAAQVKIDTYIWVCNLLQIQIQIWI